MNPLQKMMLALRALVQSTTHGRTSIAPLPPVPVPITPPDDPLPFEPFDARDHEIRKLRAITVHLQEENARLRDYADVACASISEARSICERCWLESEDMQQKIVTAVDAFKNYLLP